MLLLLLLLRVGVGVLVVIRTGSIVVIASGMRMAVGHLPASIVDAPGNHRLSGIVHRRDHKTATLENRGNGEVRGHE